MREGEAFIQRGKEEGGHLELVHVVLKTSPKQGCLYFLSTIGVSGEDKALA